MQDYESKSDQVCKQTHLDEYPEVDVQAYYEKCFQKVSDRRRYLLPCKRSAECKALHLSHKCCLGFKETTLVTAYALICVVCARLWIQSLPPPPYLAWSGLRLRSPNPTSGSSEV